MINKTQWLITCKLFRVKAFFIIAYGGISVEINNSVVFIIAHGLILQQEAVSQICFLMNLELYSVGENQKIFHTRDDVGGSSTFGFSLVFAIALMLSELG